jgi:hypothetical protein
MHLVLFTLTEREKAVDLFFSRNLLKQEPGEKRKLKPPLALSLSLSLLSERENPIRIFIHIDACIGRTEGSVCRDPLLRLIQ